MNRPPIPKNEKERLISLKQYKLLESEQEDIYDNITWVVSNVLGVPISLISLISEDRQWFKSVHGLKDTTETTRDIAFCAYTILNNEILEIEDALDDERFKNNPLVKNDPKIRFYAGSPLINKDGFPLGTLCIIDSKPKKLTLEQKEILKKMSRVVMAIFEMSKNIKNCSEEKQKLIAELNLLKNK